MLFLSRKINNFIILFEITTEILLIPTGMNVFLNGRKGTERMRKIMETLN